MGASLSALFYFLLTPFSRSVCEKISCHEIFSHTWQGGRLRGALEMLRARGMIGRFLRERNRPLNLR